MGWFTRKQTAEQRAAWAAEDAAIRAAEEAEEKRDADYLAQFTVGDNGVDFLAVGYLVRPGNGYKRRMSITLRRSILDSWSWAFEVDSEPKAYRSIRATSSRTFDYHTHAAFDLRSTVEAAGCQLEFTPRSTLGAVLRGFGLSDAQPCTRTEGG